MSKPNFLKIFGSIIFMILFISACSSNNLTPTLQEETEEPVADMENPAVDVSCDDFMKLQRISKEIEVAVDGSFTVTLCSNPTTGFQWESANISDQTVLEETSHRFVSPEENETPPPPGTAGQEVWTFKPLKAGESTISIEYSQSWEGGEKAVWIFALNVSIE